MNRRSLGVFALLIAAGALIVSYCTRAVRSAEEKFSVEVQAARIAAENTPKPNVLSEATVKEGSTFEEILRGMGVDPDAAYRIVEAARPIFNFRRLKPGNTVVLEHSADGGLESVRYSIDMGSDLHISRQGEEFVADVKEIASTVEVVGLRGELQGSLFESVLAMGESPELAVRLADIFAWDLDFYRDPQPGDTFRLALEKVTYGQGTGVSYGRILMAEYNNAGRQYQAVLYHDSKGQPAYYAADGKSLRKAFLRSPLRFAAQVSSHFTQRRLHPVLHVRRPHLGTDYAAPTGTPVQAVADGRVTWSGRKGGNGILVVLEHTRGYESYYLHLSRALVRRGQRVSQGQTIGRVGSTGLASGPHLDFRLRQRGRFLNFERVTLPSSEPLPKSELASLAAERDRWLSILPAEVPATTVAGTSTTEAGARGASQ